MTDRDDGRPDGPYGPGWSDAPDSRYVDWGASADRKPRPKTTRNASIATAAVGIFCLFLFMSGWLDNDLRWSNLAIAGSQLALSASLFSQYRTAKREVANLSPVTKDGRP